MIQSALEKLFSALEGADLEYAKLHRAMTAFFNARECGSDSEALADVTLLDRLARKIDEGQEVRNFVHYSKGIARLVYLEYLRDRDRLKNAMREMRYLKKDVQEPKEDPDLRRNCQESCVSKLSEAERRLMVDYYLSGKDRDALAEELGLLIETLRTHIHRLKKRLKECVDDCRKNSLVWEQKRLF